MRIVGKVLFFMTVLLCVACGQRPAGQQDVTDTDSATVMPLDYAKGFTVRTLANGVRLVDVADPQQDEDKMPVSYHFALVAELSFYLVILVI